MAADFTILHIYIKLFIEFIGKNNEKDNKLVHSNVTQLLEFYIFLFQKVYKIRREDRTVIETN